jgi:hypothetical protein
MLGLPKRQLLLPIGTTLLGADGQEEKLLNNALKTCKNN